MLPTMEAILYPWMGRFQPTLPDTWSPFHQEFQAPRTMTYHTILSALPEIVGSVCRESQRV